MEYSVNVFDMMRPDMRMIGPLLLGPVTKGRNVVLVGKNVDDSAVVIEADEVRAAAICDILTEKGIRCYRRNDQGAWKRVVTVPAV